MKKLLTSICISLIIACCYPTSVFAVGDGNIDGGGGGMGSGTSNNVWSPGNDGVRVTVVRAKDHAIVTIPIDITNKPPDSSIYNFGKISKIQYGNGKALFPQKGGYNCIKPPKAMEVILVLSFKKISILLIKTELTLHLFGYQTENMK